MTKIDYAFFMFNYLKRKVYLKYTLMFFDSVSLVEHSHSSRFTFIKYTGNRYICQKVNFHFRQNRKCVKFHL